MQPEPTVPYAVHTTRIATGWRGSYTLKGRVCHVRDENGFVRVFDEKEDAEKAAFRAMLRELNGPAPGVVGRARQVTKNSRYSRAEAVFAGAR
jgi:hypothetical protein